MRRENVVDQNQKPKSESQKSENKIEVVHVKNCSPPFGQEGDVYIGRASYGFPKSKWHNPFFMKDESERSKVLKQFERYLIETGLINDIKELQDVKRLGCWCSPKPCH